MMTPPPKTTINKHSENKQQTTNKTQNINKQHKQMQKE
jgi:hypothetical protein